MPEKKQFASAREVFQIYFEHLRRYPVFVALVFIGAIGIQAADLAGPWFLRQFFNTLAAHAPDPAIVSHLLQLVAIIAFIFFTSFAMRRIQDFSNMYLEALVMNDLFASAFRHLIGHSYNFFISNFAGSLTHKVSKFARAFETMFDAIAIQFFPTFLFVLGAITILFVRNHMLGLALLIWTILFMTFQIYLARLRQPARAARAEADTRVTATLADAISNHVSIMFFSGSAHERRLFSNVVGRWRSATLRSWFTDGWIWTGLGIFMLVIEVVLLAGATVLWGQGLLMIGDFVLIQAYLLTTFDRLISINRDLRRFNDAFADSSEMVAILRLPHGVPDRPSAVPLLVSSGTIDFADVQFYFHDERPVFSDFNLRIAAGEKVALVGPSGAGKTTITKLLLRLYDVKGGAILVDGQDIQRVTQDSLRDAISFVPQEPVLFHRTLMENIRYGRRDATDDEVIEVARKAHCHEFIQQLPLRYDTFVGERGVKLSGGERQRVAIARALLKNAPILVLDEATSSLDSESEALIQDALETLMAGKTVVVIAHRLSTIMKMDRIIVLDGGRVVDEGGHDDLLARDGLYRKLWSIQAGGFQKQTIPDDPIVEDEVAGDKEESEPRREEIRE